MHGSIALARKWNNASRPGCTRSRSGTAPWPRAGRTATGHCGARQTTARRSRLRTAIWRRRCNGSPNKPRFQSDREELTAQRRSLDAERARLEEFAIEQSQQVARMEREQPGKPAVVLHDPEIDSDIPVESAAAVKRAAEPAPATEEVAEPASIATSPAAAIMGQQFENVDPVLLGEPRASASAGTNPPAAEAQRPVAERIPIDPVADEAYEELVDRLVQFNYSKKKQWYKFW